MVPNTFIISLEVCANSVNSAVSAEKGGARRIELCDNITEGGITPSHGAIMSARRKMSVDLYVIIRPRGGDFLYDDTEYCIMKYNVELCKSAGADGIVTGILNSDGSVDVKRTELLVRLAYPMKVTFHRAFDMSRDPFKALDDIISIGCSRVLTSGQKEKAVQGEKLISELIQYAGNKISVMPGSGINEKNIERLVKRTGAREYHVSLRDSVKSLMKFKRNSISMSGGKNKSEYYIDVTNPERVRRVLKLAERAFIKHHLKK